MLLLLGEACFRPFGCHGKRFQVLLILCGQSLNESLALLLNGSASFSGYFEEDLENLGLLLKHGSQQNVLGEHGDEEEGKRNSQVGHLYGCDLLQALAVGFQGQMSLLPRRYYQTINRVVVQKVDMGLALVVNGRRRFHAVRLGHQFVQSKSHDHRLSGPVAVHQSGFAVVSIQVQVFVQLVYLLSQHLQLVQSTQVARKLSRVHFHIQYLGTQLVKLAYLLVAVHHGGVMELDVYVLHYAQQRASQQYGQCEYFQAENMFVAGLLLEDGAQLARLDIAHSKALLHLLLNLSYVVL